MGKFYPKAGATQQSQDKAAQDAAQEQAQTGSQGTTDATTEQSTAGASGDAATGQTTTAKVAVTEETAKDANQAAQSTASQPAAPVQDTLIVTPVAPKVAQAAAPAKAVVKEAAKPVAANAAVTDQLSDILKEVPGASRTDIGRIQMYLERMAPKRPVDAKVGKAEQLALYKSIQNIINRQEQYFTQLFSALLFLFKAEGKTGALSDRYRMRFMESVEMNVGDRKAFANLTLMLHTLADPKSRELAFKQINMERALENGLTAEGRTRVLHYFGQ